jgi:hypothetical protein
MLMGHHREMAVSMLKKQENGNYRSEHAEKRKEG